ncbi:signal peptidase II [Amylibacter sp.]|jgi:signal peptidase II|uniref:Lipoprotein signal peptidase n=1 Tax=uncultured alpha proteobacterium EB080_L06A09 TaxID=710794 RepID=E0Y0F5_9PROT|nr:lipoprotein signal peptidase [uncultured alpha proteobacterium EB080_L06A09]MDA8741774.1 signal peptidase II [Amylibacter sp.]MDA8811739.1 signal peptidase II [Amylibacter sp.]MDA9582447.1 signal peptidase II [Amylibacter sp.]MDC0982927.1 signal peptidase II [Amylibacter sp.]
MLKSLIYGIFFVLIDQLSKWFIIEKIDLDNIGIYDVYSPFLTLKMGWNTGINFGLFSGSHDYMRWILVLISIAICLFLLFWARNLKGNVVPILIGLVIGGAIGNVIDRIRFGAVVDFLNMSCCGIQNPYIFNLADIFVFTGLILLVVFLERFQK